MSLSNHQYAKLIVDFVALQIEDVVKTLYVNIRKITKIMKFDPVLDPNLDT